MTPPVRFFCIIMTSLYGAVTFTARIVESIHREPCLCAPGLVCGALCSPGAVAFDSGPFPLQPVLLEPALEALQGLLFGLCQSSGIDDGEIAARFGARLAGGLGRAAELGKHTLTLRPQALGDHGRGCDRGPGDHQ